MAKMRKLNAYLDKTTKNMIRYQISPNNKGIVGMLYVSKEKLKGDPPNHLTVKVVFDGGADNREED